MTIASPSVELLLSLDIEYREKAIAGKLKLIAPKKLNPEWKAWLPIMNVQRDGGAHDSVLKQIKGPRKTIWSFDTKGEYPMKDSSEQGFQVKFAFVAWVPPLKLKDKNGMQVESRILDAKNKAFNHFLIIFERALGDCKTEIQFKSPQLNQSNVVRSHILDIVSSKTQKSKEKSALELT